jgi:hypothetical protein
LALIQKIAGFISLSPLFLLFLQSHFNISISITKRIYGDEKCHQVDTTIPMGEEYLHPPAPLLRRCPHRHTVGYLCPDGFLRL